MPPHCDTMDGPVVKAAARALEARDCDVVLPYVPAGAEGEVRRTFDGVLEVRDQGDEARDLADRHFFETVVRLHRAGEGEPFTGLKPAGLDHGPVIPVAEGAIETGSADDLIRVLCDAVAKRAASQLSAVAELRHSADGDLEAKRRYVSAMLGFQVWAHKVYECVESAPHHARHHDDAPGA
jgi:uncharacterized protein DUF6448